MKETITILFSIILKLILSHSKLVNEAANILLFSKISAYDRVSSISVLYMNNKFDSFSNLNSLKNSINSEIASVNPLFARIINIFIDNSSLMSILLISLVDAANAKLLSRLLNLKKDEKYRTNLITFYLFNPITICSCIKRQSVSFNIFIILLIFNNIDNFKVYFLCLLGIFFSNEHLVFFSILIIYSYHKSSLETYKKCIIILLGIVFLGVSSNLIYQDFFHIFKSIFNKKDTYPNIGLLWGILNETFLKFRDFSILISLLYNLINGVIIVYLAIKLRDVCSKANTNCNTLDSKSIYSNEEGNIIFFSLLYTYQLISDWYPSEMNIIVMLCLISQIYYKLRNVYLNFGVSYIYIFINYTSW